MNRYVDKLKRTMNSIYSHLPAQGLLVDPVHALLGQIVALHSVHTVYMSNAARSLP